MAHRFALAALAVAAAAVSPLANAADVALATDGAWRSFAVDSLLAPPAVGVGWIDDGGNALAFTFSVGSGLFGMLTVVDAGFAGDVFSVSNFGAALGSTSPVPIGSYEASPDAGTDFDAALADTRFSRAVFDLAPGAYRVSGRLTQSVSFGGAPLEATVGALRLTVAAPVPEPSSLALLAAGIGIAGALARRRRSGRS